ncbi:DUF308 domain-containing protein [Streptomyces aquilus]|nr:DUF308 domain-containing protein [Streptomyces aquilus]
MTTTRSSGLRSLHLIRVAFSLIWVALVGTTSASLVSTDRPTAIAAVLLVVYPLWDVIATLLERRLAGPGSEDRARTANMALGLAATAGMIIAVFSTIGTTLLVFGVWALLSGAIQLVVAIRRRHAVGAQWPMVISGGLSVLAGISFAAMSASATSGLSSVAGYSAFGAFWFLVSAVALTIRSRRAMQ